VPLTLSPWISGRHLRRFCGRQSPSILPGVLPIFDEGMCVTHRIGRSNCRAQRFDWQAHDGYSATAPQSQGILVHSPSPRPNIRSSIARFRFLTPTGVTLRNLSSDLEEGGYETRPYVARKILAKMTRIYSIAMQSMCPSYKFCIVALSYSVPMQSIGTKNRHFPLLTVPTNCRSSAQTTVLRMPVPRVNEKFSVSLYPRGRKTGDTPLLDFSAGHQDHVRGRSVAPSVSKATVDLEPFKILNAIGFISNSTQGRKPARPRLAPLRRAPCS
jgi:hypothetical protein